jgi:hypothetical protein
MKMQMTEHESRLHRLQREAVFARATLARMTTDAGRAVCTRNVEDIDNRIQAMQAAVVDYDAENRAYRWRALGADVCAALIGVMVGLVLLGLYLVLKTW